SGLDQFFRAGLAKKRKHALHDRRSVGGEVLVTEDVAPVRVQQSERIDALVDVVPVLGPTVAAFAVLLDAAGDLRVVIIPSGVIKGVVKRVDTVERVAYKEQIQHLAREDVVDERKQAVIIGRLVDPARFALSRSVATQKGFHELSDLVANLFLCKPQR